MAFYLLFAGTLGGIYALLALSLNMAWGSAGLVNFGLAGFFGIGAYATALVTGAGAPVLLGLLSAMFCAVAAGLLVTVVTLRLRDDYLAIVTLGFAEIIRLVALNELWLTHGSDGLSGIVAPGRAMLGLTGFNIAYFVVVTLIVGAVWWLLRRLDAGPFGRALRAVREDQVLAGFAAKPVLRLKLQAFAVSTAIAGLAGALYAHFLSFISPEHLQPDITIEIFLALTAGGLGRPTGAVAGAYVVLIFMEGTRFLAGATPGLTPVQATSVREAAVGLALLLVLNLRPRGMLPETIPPARSTARPSPREVASRPFYSEVGK
jgi:branched-chain amino acid transport system permease protein